MRRAGLYGWEIPLEAGVVLRDRRLKTRSGLLVRLTEADREGWGEISPLPGFSTESLDDARHATLVWLAAWCRGENLADCPLPSVAFGLSCAQAELNGQLPDEGNFNSALLCVGDPDDLFLRLQQQAEPLAKMKVGLYEAVCDGLMVNLLLEALPALTLRLDANRSWSLEKALTFARYVPEQLRSRIAFLEEPCRDPQESRHFAAETGIAIAWDESTREAGFQPRAEPHVSAVILKPTLLGSLQKVRAMAQQAQQAGLTVVISSSLESSLGLTQLARIAQGLTPGTTPGLDTLNLMQHQLVRRWPGCELPLIASDALEVIWQL
ncbi:o-succinylbenzoate synthase [Erwinia billingiae Eb661]|uniref:o-succinylbenzoate synthase n=1 Tax=Erwinia billingiae (strain Eb661) TaxID=634500 RepID=D8MUS3_ERWBE|nr:o-succinylbenzoate synthase [Erwinia billingiae]CAX60580.1 o-succinylbenzoate synthase [Erwinia billingiae Eb661]